MEKDINPHDITNKQTNKKKFMKEGNKNKATSGRNLKKMQQKNAILPPHNAQLEIKLTILYKVQNVNVKMCVYLKKRIITLICTHAYINTSSKYIKLSAKC